MKITRNVTCPSLGNNYGGIQLGLSYRNEFISHVKILHYTEGIWELGMDKMKRLLAYFSNRKKIVEIGVTRQGKDSYQLPVSLSWLNLVIFGTVLTYACGSKFIF